MSEVNFDKSIFDIGDMKNDMQDVNKNYGKFKDASKLYDAYNNLEKEFTKKCQELGDLKKNKVADNKLENITNASKVAEEQMSNKDSSKSIIDNNNSLKEKHDDDVVEILKSNKEENDLDKKAINVEQGENPPQKLYGYDTESWRDEIKEFLNTHKDANRFAKEIGSVLIQDKELAKMPNSLELAYNKVLASKFVPYNELIQDNEFLNKYIYSNEIIVKSIISNYLNNVNSKSCAPIVLDKKGNSICLVRDTVGNLEEAKNLLSKMLMQK